MRKMKWAVWAMAAAGAVLWPAGAYAGSGAFTSLRVQAGEAALAQGETGGFKTAKVGQAATVPITFVEVWKDPTDAQLKVADEILAEARQALKAGRKAEYKEKMKKLKYFSEGRKVRKGFAGRILCGEEVAFQSEEAHEACGEALVFETACYKGTAEGAAEIVRAALRNHEWNWDEQWAAKPRVEGDFLLIDIVDGPNDARETVKVGACK